MPAAVRSARSRLEELRGGSLRHRVTLTRALVAPSPAFLRWRYGDLPLPSLYARRWRSLHQRAFDPGRGVTNAPRRRRSGPLPYRRIRCRIPGRSPSPSCGTTERAGPSGELRSSPPVDHRTVAPSRSPNDRRGRRASQPRHHARGRPWGRTTGPVEPRPPQPVPSNGDAGGRRGPPPSRAAPDGPRTTPRARRPPLRSSSPRPAACRGRWPVGDVSIAAALASQLDHVSAGLVLVPLAAVLLATAMARRIARAPP